VKEQFYDEVALIEVEAKSFIDASFKSLRSAEGAFEMLLNFRHIRSRDSINSQMMRKFNDILAQFDKEVVHVYFSFCGITMQFCSTTGVALYTLVDTP